jgi:hypothetical protein
VFSTYTPKKAPHEHKMSELRTDFPQEWKQMRVDAFWLSSKLQTLSAIKKEEITSIYVKCL